MPMLNNYIEKQATINIGTIGHVAHGKTTIVHCITGRSTIRYKDELEKNITIKLGYANAKIFACKCERPKCYSVKEGKCAKCDNDYKLVRHVSFVDCPGHDVLMTTMLNGTAVMDAALLLVAANEPCPQPQTVEHLFALEIMNLKSVVILQNKIDLVTKEQAIEQHGQIEQFLKTSSLTGPIAPVSGQFNLNIEAILDLLVNYIKEPVRDLVKPEKMMIIRSFDINRPGTKVSNLKGGIIGGSLVSGILKLGTEIEIRPGIVVKDNEAGFICYPFISTVRSLNSERNELKEAIPGGLIGVGTGLDPNFCKGDRLVGMVMGLRGTLSPVYYNIIIKYELFHKTLTTSSKESLKLGENILLNVGSSSVGCKIYKIDEVKMSLEMIRPCCCDIGDRVAISRKVKNNWRLVGFGTILSGKEAKIAYLQ